MNKKDLEMGPASTYFRPRTIYDEGGKNNIPNSQNTGEWWFLLYVLDQYINTNEEEIQEDDKTKTLLFLYLKSYYADILEYGSYAVLTSMETEIFSINHLLYRHVCKLKAFIKTVLMEEESKMSEEEKKAFNDCMNWEPDSKEGEKDE
jgi:hypothetical protein